MRIRLMAAFAMLILWAALPASGAAYRNSDNGVLGTMKREAEGRVRFSRLANCISMVLRDSGIKEGELRKLKEGRRVVIDERIFQNSFHPSKETVRESRRILDADSGAAQRAAVKELKAQFQKERAAYEKRLSVLRQEAEDLRRQLERQKKDALIAAEASNQLILEANKAKDAAAAKAKSAEDEVSRLRSSIGREFLRKALGVPIVQQVAWGLFGVFLGMFFYFVRMELAYKPKRFIRKKRIVLKYNGHRCSFTWNEETGGYDCDDCVSRQAFIPEDEIPEIGRNLKLEELMPHLSRTRIHSRLKMVA